MFFFPRESNVDYWRFHFCIKNEFLFLLSTDNKLNYYYLRMESSDENNSTREIEEEEEEDDESSIGGSSINELEQDADTETLMDGDFQKPVPEASVNVSATIMLKVPTYSLAPLRQCFEAEPDGLNLYQFLKAFVANMDLESDQDLLSVVPDLVGRKMKIYEIYVANVIIIIFPIRVL